jgi:hypothetical protein
MPELRARRRSETAGPAAAPVPEAPPPAPDAEPPKRLFRQAARELNPVRAGNYQIQRDHAGRKFLASREEVVRVGPGSAADGEAASGGNNRAMMPLIVSQER